MDRITTTITLICLILLTTACFTGLVSAPSDTIKIGAVLPLNGYGSEIGENSLRGYRLAIDEVNRAGGVLGRSLELVVADHVGDDTKGAVSAYRFLEQQDIKLILGPNFSPIGQAIAPMACEDGALLISPAIGVEDFTTPCSLIFNLWPVDKENSKLMGKTVADSGYKQIAIIGSVQSWEIEQANAVREGVLSVNGKIVSFTITDNTPSDYLTESTKVIGSKPDAIIFTNYGYMHIMAQRLRQLGSDADYFVIVMDETSKNKANGAFEGAIGISSFTPTIAFTSLYNSTYGRMPDFNTDTSYDAVMLIAKAVEATKGTDPVVVAEFISNLSTYQGASGNVTFTSMRAVTKRTAFQIVRNDSIQIYNWQDHPKHS